MTEETITSDDSFISISESLISESTIIDDSNKDCEIEIHSFIWDKIGFEKVYAIVNVNENEEFSWEDIEIEDKNMDSVSIFEQKSELTEEDAYLIEDVTVKI
ncbi:9744_t:CDS:2 [Ambispora leptoticha]|uniref:9744_t:CDS:1 n=1 Tax=Ambispora leptoticha TaxID=144679 RepID=A0A9N9DRA4_9GLOM|nr:9744_t:CDS:2 [Ambispora leptoticha]